MIERKKEKKGFASLREGRMALLCPTAALDAACHLCGNAQSGVGRPENRRGLAKRGFRVLCANVMVKEGLFFTQVEKMKAVKAAIEYLRSALLRNLNRFPAICYNAE